ncbi:hypothetical protein Glove_74g193 [Diversispora epigaea]|uniref:Conserved oligomeric Golgi complex subunit 7 n=1 Tax=Diversispora epigaea TaxID=1348612 RepID=A0A397J968_9GLOM|nr:hypothetical protein Glove_74g193 [Diversispora epigaea]
MFLLFNHIYGDAICIQHPFHSTIPTIIRNIFQSLCRCFRQKGNNTIEPDETKKFKFNERKLLFLENHASNTVEKLQYLNQGILHQLENTIEGVVKNIPSIMTELQIIQQNSENLKESVALVKSSLRNVENNTNEAIERLKY